MENRTGWWTVLMAVRLWGMCTAFLDKATQRGSCPCAHTWPLPPLLKPAPLPHLSLPLPIQS